MAEAFKLLRESGKVKFFGVSNFHPLQIELLKKTLPSDMPLVVNQLQFGLMANHMVAEGIHVNRHEAEAVNRDGYAFRLCSTSSDDGTGLVALSTHDGRIVYRPTRVS